MQNKIVIRVERVILILLGLAWIALKASVIIVTWRYG